MFFITFKRNLSAPAETMSVSAALAKINKSGDDTKDKGDYSESNFDEFGGYSESLFGDTPYAD